MRIILLTTRQSNQVALANKIANVADVTGIVFSRNVPRRRPALKKRGKLLLNKVAGRIVGREFLDAWFRMLRRYESLFPEPPISETTEVENVNDPATLQAIKRLKPDLIVVSGTNLVGRDLIAAGQECLGVINLHTGISPYVKGGPNCTNWCLARNWFHLIGNTVMWLDAGIDTGNIIATEQTPLSGEESLFELHWAVMEHAHEMYCRTIERIAASLPVCSVPQSRMAEGSHFNSVDWNAIEMWRASRNFRLNYRPHFKDQGKLASLNARLDLVGSADV